MLRGTAHRYWVQWLLLGIALLTLGAVIGYVLYMEYSRVDALERDRLQVQARVVDVNLGRQLQGANDALAGVRDEFPPPVNKSVAKAASRHLKALSDSMPGVRTMLLVDAEGTVLAASRDELIGLNASEREYFTVPRERPDLAMLYVSPPFRTTLGVFSINVVRVVTGSRGEFAGIVSATLDPEYFAVLLNSVLYTPEMRAAVIHGDGKVIVEEPSRKDLAGRDLAKPGSRYTKHVESDKAANIFVTGTAYTTGDQRMSAWRTIRPASLRMDKPLMVSVNRDMAGIFASWRRDVYVDGGLFGALLLTTTLGLFYYQRRQMAHDRLEASYEAERKRVERELQHKTELAQLLERLARAANEAVSPEAAMDVCLRRICEDGKWALGRVITFRTEESRFKAEHSQWFCTEPARFDTFMRYSDDLEFEVDYGRFVGAVLREQRTVWLPDLVAIDKSNRGRLMMAAEAGFKAAFAFPVIVKGKVVAALEFFATETRQPDAPLIAATNGLAGQFARLIERSRAAETNAWLAAIVEHSSAAIVGRAADFTVTSWNAAAERLFGYTAAEVIGRDLVEIFPPEARHHTAAMLNLARTGQPVPNHEAVRVAKDGRRLDVTVSVSAIRDSSGNIFGTATIVHDISERKRAEETRVRLAAIVEHSSEAIVGRTVDGTVTSWNAAAERLFGYTAAEAIGRKMIEIHPPELHDEIGEHRQLLAAGQPVANFETARITKDGRRIDVTLSASPIRDNSGNIIGTGAILRDITERKRTEGALRDSSKRLRDLSQRLIEAEDAVRRRINRELHDRVGANLSGLSLSFSMLMSKLSPESLRAVGARLDDTQRLLDETITHIRDVMAELHPPALDDYGLHAALRSYAVAMSERFAVPITVRGEDLVPRLPLATETALFRVAQGALANAITHAHATRIEILLAASPDKATLTVADDGVGFDVAQASLTHASWGLAIMRERAEAVGARLTVESAPGKGTRVCVEIPRGGGRRNAE